VIIQGRLAEPGEVGGFVFHALEGQNLSVEVVQKIRLNRKPKQAVTEEILRIDR
jgi:hypothetical protein